MLSVHIHAPPRRGAGARVETRPAAAATEQLNLPRLKSLAVWTHRSLMQNDDERGYETLLGSGLPVLQAMQRFHQGPVQTPSHAGVFCERSLRSVTTACLVKMVGR